MFRGFWARCVAIAWLCSFFLFTSVNEETIVSDDQNLNDEFDVDSVYLHTMMIRTNDEFNVNVYFNDSMYLHTPLWLSVSHKISLSIYSNHNLQK